jgi:hypothetical protein
MIVAYPTQCVSKIETKIRNCFTKKKRTMTPFLSISSRDKSHIRALQLFDILRPPPARVF